MIDPLTLRPGDRFIDEYGDTIEVIEIGHGIAKCLDVKEGETLSFIYSGSNEFFPWDTGVMVEAANQGETA